MKEALVRKNAPDVAAAAAIMSQSSRARSCAVLLCLKATEERASLEILEPVSAELQV